MEEMGLELSLGEWVRFGKAKERAVLGRTQSETELQMEPGRWGASAEVSLRSGGVNGGPDDSAGRTPKRVDTDNEAETFRPKAAKYRNNNPIERF